MGGSTIYEKKRKKKSLFVAIVIKYFRVELCSNSFHNTKWRWNIKRKRGGVEWCKTTEADATRLRRLALVRRSNAAPVTANDVVVSFFFFFLTRKRRKISHHARAIRVTSGPTTDRSTRVCDVRCSLSSHSHWCCSVSLIFREPANVVTATPPPPPKKKNFIWY